LDRENFAWARIATSNNTLRKKVVWQTNSRKLTAENFYGENVEKSIKFVKFVNISPIEILHLSWLFWSFLKLSGRTILGKIDGTFWSGWMVLGPFCAAQNVPTLPVLVRL